MGEMIRLTATDGHELGAYRADPAGPAKGSLVIIQEIFGLSNHMRAVCDEFAADGYVAVAPALFDRLEPDLVLAYDEPGVARGRALRAEVGWYGPVADIAAALAVLDAPVGVVGYCWGGSLAWLAATRVPGVACSVGYYGGHIAEFKEETPQCPVLLHFGEQDAGIPLDDVEAVRSAHPDVPIHLYPAGHGFNCPDRASYAPESAKLARERTMAFLTHCMA